MTEQFLYSKTAKGLRELANKKPGLSPIALQVLTLVDGKSDNSRLQAMIAETSTQEIKQALDVLLAAGLIRQIEADDDAFPGNEGSIAVTEFDAEEGVRAWAEAQRCATALKDEGFYALNEHQPAAGKELQALVVEDTRSTAQLEIALLKVEGFTVRHAANGKEADEILQVMIPHLIILDINLPDTTGLIILEKLRSHPRLGSVPVILVTANVGEKDVLAGIRAGADGYIFKPFRPDSLTGCVRRVLNIGK